ncbi:MAG: Magnesium transporter MgtE [Chloroflexi bacterium ADurb.Bin180]|nr:MAG: Magnesium transporter MgtE [Chloroflexi bacterium ADurb.Bin180]HOU24103.1 CBS and ACT domain-containing protein [Anaerolineae bacterium]
MLVRERMTHNPITIKDDTSLDDALRIMRENKVRRLPILDASGKLVGIVSEKDLLYASPSPATSLSVWEIHGLLSRIRVSELMTKNVITVCEDCPIEEAARIMVDNKIGGLPVMRGNTMVGIITETDLFKTFLELMGAREQGTRFTLLVPEKPGMLAALAGRITQLGGNIVALGTFLGDDPTNRELMLKVQNVEKEVLWPRIEELGIKLIDVRES